MARYRTLKEWKALKGDEALTDPELHLIDCCRRGEPCILGDGKRPEGPDPDRTIRAELLRYLILGGSDDCRVDEIGVMLSGAYVRDRLDLRFTAAAGVTHLTHCDFEKDLWALHAKLQMLNMWGSMVPGLDAQGAEITGHVFLRDGFCATGRVGFAGAKIGGQLVCSDGRFENATGDAFDADRLRVEQGFFWYNVSIGSGSITLVSAHVGDLADDTESWPGPDRLVIDGFTYDKIGTFTDVAKRLAWLAKGDHWDGEFLPQPYTQLAKVYRETGHERAARRVLIEKERRQASAQMLADRKRARALWDGEEGARGDIGWHWWRRTSFRLWNGLVRRLVGYGYAPQYALYWSMGMLIALTAFYYIVWTWGGMVPASAVVLNSADWAAAMASEPGAPALVWAGTPSGAHYETFWSGFYAADVFIPLVNFGQEAAWSATTQNAPGALAFVVTFAAKSFGWFVTALGAAAITGIIRRD